MYGYSYPVLWQNRLWLLDDVSGQRNSAICSEMDTVCVFNGSNAVTPDAPMLFGADDPLMGGATLFTRYGGSLYDNLSILKKNESWVIDGTTPSDFRKYEIGENYGTIAPATLVKCDLGYELAAGLTKHILIWRAEKAIVAFDGNSTFPISRDIENYFNPNKSEYS